MITRNENLRNIAIIAHVDHGKTTLVDQIFKQSGTFRDNQEVNERVMDNMDLERERGITISAKNCSVWWNDIKINILDTPGHADFGGEVERALRMVDGAILLVDASEGPLPQTRFVLKKALELNLSLITIINKVDRKDARIQEVLDEVYDLFIDLDAREDQIDFPVLYAIGRDGMAKHRMEDDSNNLIPLFETICQRIPPPSYDSEAPFQMLVSDLGYSEYLGRLAIGRVINGHIHKNESMVCLSEKKQISLRVSKLQTYEGIKMAEVEDVQPGDILILSGIEDIHIGDTVCTAEQPKALPRITVDKPTVSMRFTINTSPFAGREGKYTQITRIRDRLHKETLKNVSLEIEETENAEAFLVKGRGELQMAILIETMRREGYELTVGRPEVIYRKENGQILEPIEEVYIDCDDAYLGVITEKLAFRKGRMVNLVNHGTGRIRAQFNIPARGLIGFRNEFLTDTRGTGLLNTMFVGYEPFRGNFTTRIAGSIISDRQGEAIAYALFNLEPRGILFVTPGELVYEGMIIGEHNRDSDLNVNPCKGKKLTNMRATGKDEHVILTPVLPITLEWAIEFIKEDEMVEVTPKNIRLRKRILPITERQSAAARMKKATD
ncbi:MAG: translational GTPase TypA [SAR324 cluster bacterium]|nr:translational GTPase TypA [SAR324 cluster bacterium]